MKKLLEKLNDLDVILNENNGNLEIKAPEGVVTQELLSEIKAHKDMLLIFLQEYNLQNILPQIAKTKEKEYYPLSSSQYGLWLLHEMEKKKAIYNMPNAYAIYGKIDVATFEESITELIKKHEILRTNFKTEAKTGIPVQFIHSIDDHLFKFEYLDLIKEGEILVENRRNKEFKYSFDLEKESLIRVTLIKIKKDEYQLIFVLHHIISDVWSSTVILKELLSNYRQLLKGKTITDIPLSIQYKDYAEWQQMRISTNETSKRYWIDKFKGEIPVLELPTHQTRPPVKTYNGAYQSKILDQNTVKAFEKICIENGASLFMGFQALLKVLFYRYTGQEDIIIGSPISGRELPELQGQIGFYVNMLALHSKLNGKDSFLQTLEKIRNNTLNAYKYQDYPFDRLVQDLNIFSDRSRNPLFDVVFSIDDKQSDTEIAFEDIKIEELLFESNTSKFDLEFLLVKNKDLYELQITYNTDLFLDVFIEGMIMQINKLLISIIDKPSLAIKGLEYIPDQEKEKLLNSFNDTIIEYPKDKTFIELFEEIVKAYPNNVAIKNEKYSITYKELNSLSDALAFYLRENFKVRPGDCIGVNFVRDQWLVISFIASLKINAIYVPIDTQFPQERIAFIKQDSNTKVVIDNSFVANYKNLKIDLNKSFNTRTDSTNNDIAYVIYTSGTTGTPKGVMISQQSLVNLCYWHKKEYDVKEKSRATLYAGISFDASIWEMAPYLLSGSTLYPLNDENIRLNISKLCSYLNENSISHAYLPTTICHNLIHGGEELKDIKILTGGDTLKLKKAPRFQLYNNYGPTENTVVATSYLVNEGKSNESSIPIGSPISNTRVYILDEHLELLPVGFSGKLYISGDGLAKGYLNRTDLTMEKFVSNPFIKGQKMYDTGDMAKWLPDGNIEFLGRKDSQIKLNGHRIELEEIEKNILQFEGVQNSILDIRKIKGDKKIIAYLKCNDRVEINKLLQELKKRLPQYMIPSSFVFINKIPLTSNGKVNKKLLPDPDYKEQMSMYVAPETPLEKELLLLWEKFFEMKGIGVETSFFDLGGNSLRMVELMHKIRTDLGYEIDFNILYQNSTIRSFIPYLKQSKQLKILPVKGLDAYPLTSSQFRFWVLCQIEDINRAYNIPITIKLIGNLNLKALKEAFDHILMRHNSLTTYFVKDSKGGVNQLIANSEEIDFKLEVKKTISIEELRSSLIEFAKTPFDLTKAPLLKAKLFQLKKNENYLCINLHHIIGDGQSVQILISELAGFYNAAIKEEKISLSKLSIQFKDYAVWTQNKLKGESDKEQLFWLDELEGELPVLDLPTFQTRPPIQTFIGAYTEKNIEKNIYHAITNVSKEYQTTTFSVVLAALNALLSRYTGQTDMILGTPVSLRTYPELESQIGLFINTIPLRTRFEEKEKFSDLIEIQKEVLLKSLANANYPFEELIEQLDIKRDTSRSPIFDVLVIHQYEKRVLQFIETFDELEVEVTDLIENDVSKYDITIIFTEAQGELTMGVEYNTSLYQRDFITDFMDDYISFLKIVVNKPDVSIHQVDYLSAEKKQLLLESFNDTKLPYQMQNSVVELFIKKALSQPNYIAIQFGEENISYEELYLRSTKVAEHLVQEGIKDHDIVGICCDRSINMVVGILGILRSGATYLPIDPFYPLERIDYILKHSKTKLVLTNNKTHQILPSGCEILNIDTFENWEETSEEDNLHLPDASTIAYVLYTSGSTGKPKGVQVSHQNLMNFITGMNVIFKTSTSQEVWLATTSVSFDISILELLWTLTRGSKVVLQREHPIPLKEKAQMDFSLLYFPTGKATETNVYKLLMEGSSFADSNDFSAVWIPERHFHNFGNQFPNPSVAAAAVAATTQSIKIRSGSVVLPLHDTVRVAEEWSMVDNLSNGRVELSIASGWHPNDFVLAPENYQDRHGIMRKKIQELKLLWEGKMLKRKNGKGVDFEFGSRPRPVQKTLNIWITAAGNVETFKYAGKIGANILTHLLGQDSEELKHKIQAYKDTLKEHGYDESKAKIALMLHTFIGTDEKEVKTIVEGPFKNYLKDSINLLTPFAKEQNLDINTDIDKVLEIGFKRFYETSSLFGTLESGLDRVEKFYQIGVTEIACLIDFGINEDQVIESFQHLNRLRETVWRQRYQYDHLVNKMQELKLHNSTASLIVEHQVNYMQATPSFYEEFVKDDHNFNALKEMKALLVGGEALKEKVASKLLEVDRGVLYNMYGPTETTIWSTVKKIQDKKKITIGKPIANTKIYILDNHLQLCPVGVSGELYIGGDGVSKGYIHNQELTDDRFIPDPFTNNEKIYRTGDIAKWLPNGELYYLGRTDHQVKIRGYRIELLEIENVICDIPGIVQSAVTTYMADEQVHVAAYLKNEHKDKEHLIRQTLQLRLPNYMLPTQLVFIEELPLTPNGKIDKKRLPSPTNSNRELKQVTAPRNELEKKMVEIWSTYLNTKKIGIDDNFFEIGGNSMKAFQLLTTINEKLQLDLKIISFFQFPTIRLLVEDLRRSEDQIEIEENEMEDVDDLFEFMNDI